MGGGEKFLTMSAFQLPPVREARTKSVLLHQSPSETAKKKKEAGFQRPLLGTDTGLCTLSDASEKKCAHTTPVSKAPEQKSWRWVASFSSTLPSALFFLKVEDSILPKTQKLHVSRQAAPAEHTSLRVGVLKWRGKKYGEAHTIICASFRLANSIGELEELPSGLSA